VTVAATSSFGSAPETRRERMLPRVVEFLMVGGATPFLFPIAWLLRRSLGLDPAELAVGFLFFHAAHVVNDPHFSVTYLLFYKDVKRRALGDAWSAAQRTRYVVAGFVVPAVLVAWAGGALAARSAVALGWLIQLMFFLVGWHYVKQGFGVLTALSARNGVRFGTGERRVLLAHSLAGWAYAWANPADPGTEMEERGVVFMTLPHGPALERAALVVFAVSAVLVVAVVVRRLKSAEGFPPVGALLGYFSAIWVWTVFSRVDPLVVYAIPALHSLQYLYFVWLLKSGETVAAVKRPFESRSDVVRLLVFAASAVGLAWLVFHGVPETLDVAFFVPRGRPADLGKLGAAPCVAAVFVCVNVHHYFMDAVIWRRDNPQASFAISAKSSGTLERAADGSSSL
jgi:hypothetical protein